MSTILNVDCFYKPFPKIKIDDELSLREISMNDAEAYHKYMTNPLMKEVLCAEHIPVTLADAAEELQYWRSLFWSKRSIYWALANSDDKLIGTAGFNNISFKNARAELSYDLAPECWGGGYMSKAIEKIIEFAKDELGVVRLQATVASNNHRSIKLLERCGFKQEGLLEKYEIVNGSHCDYFIYSLLR